MSREIVTSFKKVHDTVSLFQTVSTVSFVLEVTQESCKFYDCMNSPTSPQWASNRSYSFFRLIVSFNFTRQTVIIEKWFNAVLLIGKHAESKDDKKYFSETLQHRIVYLEWTFQGQWWFNILPVLKEGGWNVAKKLDNLGRLPLRNNGNLTIELFDGYCLWSK